MAIIRQIVCDQCGEVLEGRKGTAEVHQNHIWIQGKFAQETWDDDTRRWSYVFITPGTGEQVAFCDFKCLQAYAKMKQEFWTNRKKAQLMAEANGETIAPSVEDQEAVGTHA